MAAIILVQDERDEARETARDARRVKREDKLDTRNDEAASTSAAEVRRNFVVIAAVEPQSVCVVG